MNAVDIITKQRAQWAGPDGYPTAVRVCDILLELITQPSGKVSDEMVERAMKSWFKDDYQNGMVMGVAATLDIHGEMRAALEAAQLPARPVVGITMEMIERYADARVDEYMHSEPPAAPSRETMDHVDKEVSEARSAIISALEGEEE